MLRRVHSPKGHICTEKICVFGAQQTALALYEDRLGEQNVMSNFSEGFQYKMERHVILEVLSAALSKFIAK